MLPFLLLLHGLLQNPSQPAVTTLEQARPGLAVTVERRAERFDYHIENPSNFEPGPLVPHFFEQRYDADNTWLYVTAHYRFLGGPASTAVGLTPRITTSGSDIDTFFQPSGDVITSGTRGDVRLHALTIEQRIEMTSWRSVSLGVGVAYRRFEMDFLPSDRIVTHSQPASETREPVSGNETTWSHVVESGVTATLPLSAGTRWALVLDVAANPLTRARLNISLPEKYPGETIRADSFSFGTRGRLAAEGRWQRLGIAAAVTVGGAWGYRHSARYHERHAGAELSVRVPLR